MLYWALIFLIVALISAVVGFGGIVSGTAAWATQVAFIIFLILFLTTLIGAAWSPPRG